MALKKIYLLFLKYGFLLILFSIFDIFSPDFYPKVLLSDLNLDSLVANQSGSSLNKQIFWMVLFAFFTSQFWIFRLRNNANLEFIKLLALMLVLPLICLVSIIWSEYPQHGFKRGIFQFIFISVVSISAFYSLAYGTFTNSIRITSAVVIIYVFYSILIGNGFSSQGALIGYFSNKNVLGGAALALIMLNHFFDKSSSTKDIFVRNIITLLLAILLVLSMSKTNIAIFVLVTALSYLRLTILKTVTISFVLIFSATFIWLPISELFTGQYVVFSDFVSSDFITGRGLIWETIYYDLNKFDKLYFGYGYGNFFGVPEIPYYFDNAFSFLMFITSAHNGYIELLIQFGIIVSTIIVTLLIKLLSLMTRKEQYLLAVIPVLQNLTESTLLKDASIYWFVFIIAILFHAMLKVGSLANDI